MADYEARVGIDFDVTQATAALQRLQQQISAFQSALGKGSAASAKAASNLQRDLLNNINATGKFSASITTVSSSAENFTRALENNKLSLSQYFKYAGASTKTFGRFFKSEFDTINKVVRERVKTIQTQFIKMGRDSNGALQAIKIRPLALDLQNYGTQAQMAAQRQAVFNQLIKQGSTNLLNFGKNTQWAGRQLMVGFTIPLSIMGATAVKEFEKIEKQAIRFKRVYGDAFSTTAETDDALKNVRELAKEFTKYGLEVEKTLELAADAAQMGLKGTDLLAQVTEATRLAVLGEVEQQEALETSISLTNAFGISAEELANKINFLNAVENETVTAISDLTTAIPKAGPVIQQLGGSVEDLAFFLTAMKEGGINASEGANALKSGLAKIINPTEKASQMLGGLGINIRGIVEANAGDIKSTVLELASALDSLDPLNRARAIEELFGRFQFARISTLFQNIVKEGSQAERVLKLSRASAEELAILSERELKRVEDSPLFKFQKQIEQLQAALAPLGEEFLKAITPIVEFAKGFLDNFNNMSDGAKRFAVIATTVIAGIGPIALMTFGLIANGVANLIKMFAGIGRVVGGFGQKTTNLGLQTQYLTNEQLESQAAAISMGQAHGQLTQILTSETAAVSQLAAAYNTMTAAQTRAAAMQGIRLPGKGSAGLKKYAKGVMSVPGPKGAGDIVPAMLSPGEAVIPAKQAKEYSGLIRGMITNTIPKFAEGTDSVKRTQASIHRTASTTGIIAAHGADFKRLTDSEAKAFAKKYLEPGTRAYASFMQPTGRGRNVYSNLVFGMPGSFNTGNMTGTDAAKWIRGNRSAFFAYLSNMYGLDPNSPASKTYANTVARSLASQKDKLISDNIFYKSVGQASSAVTDKTLRGALRQAATAFATGEVFSKSGKSRREALAGTGPSYTRRRNTIRKLYGAQASQFDQGIVKSTTGAPKPSNVKRVGGKPTDNRMVAVSKGETIVSKRSTDALRRGKFAFIPNLGIIGKADGMPAGQAPVEQRVDSRGRTYYYAPGKGRVSASTAQQMMAQQNQPQPPKQSRMPRFGAGSVGMLAGMGAMGYSMSGGPGADIAGMAALPLMMLPQLLPLLMNPIALAVVALGGLAVAAFALNEQFKKNVKESYSLTMATGASSEALEQFAEFGGNVTAGQIMDKRRAEGNNVFQIAQGKTQFGEAYLQSEAGQQVLTSFGKNMEKLGRSGAMQALSNQMAVAVASGALQPSQARDIVAALGKELDDYNLSIEINSKLLTLLGPNGENLLREPLEIRLGIIEDARSRINIDSINPNLGKLIPKLGTLLGGENGLPPWVAAILNNPLLPFFNIGAEATNRRSGATGSLNAEQIGYFAGVSAIALQNQQEMVDSLQIEYERRIANAKEQGNLALAAELEAEYAQSRNTLLLENAKTYDQINDTFAQIENKSAVLSGISDQIKGLYKDDPVMSGIVGGLLDTLKGLDDEQELVLQLSLLSGDISPAALSNMFSNMTHTASVELVTKLGATGAVGVSELAGLFGDQTSEINVGGPDVARGAVASQTVVTRISDQIITKVLGMTPGAAAEYVKQFDPVIQSLSALGEGGLQEGLKFFFENPEVLTQVNEELTLFKDTVGDGKVTLDIIQEVYGQEMVDDIKGNQEYFDKLDKDQKIVYTTVLEVLGKIDPVALQAMAINASLAGGIAFDKFKELSGGMNLKGMEQAYARFGPQGTGFAKTPQTLAIEAFKEAYAEMLTSIMSPSGLGGEGEDVGEGGKNVLDDIFDRLKRVRNAAVGAKRDIDELIRLMKPGTNTTKFFRGTDQKLLLAGYGREFVDAVMGMDEETRSSFVSIKNGVVKVTEAGKALNKAFSEITLGDFQLSLLQGVADTNKQIQALNTLIGKGMSVANAMDVVSDASLAYAIATATTDEEVVKLINDFKRLEAAQRSLNFQTKEGSAEEFGKIYDKATGFLEAQKSTFNAQFEIDTNADQDIIREAQDNINALNFELDNYQAELSSIEQQENEVNKRYDDRIDALNKIQSVNEEIARQEAANLKIADAVAAGDIAAAARALRDKQAEEAAAAAQRREAAIEQARELELSKLVSDKGRTREEIQNKVRDIQLEILKIEEERLEPAQERIRLLDVERQKALDSLDDQIDRWNLLSAQVNESKLSLSEAEMSALEYQAGLIEQMLDDWDNIENREATLTIIKKTFGDDAIGPGSDLPSSSPSANTEVVNPNQAEIDDLNRLRKISREKYRASTDEAYKKRLWDINVARGQRIKALGGTPMAKGGLVKYYPMGGLIPYMNSGGLFKSINTDTVPAMLTPGEFVMRRNSVNKYGTGMMKALNAGTYSGNSMYNYSVNVNVKTDANPDQIARAVMTQIRSVESQKIRGNRF